MSLTIEDWFEKDMEYANNLKHGIPRLHNLQVIIWDFENDEMRLDKKDISITLWQTNKNADIQQRRRFMDLQKTILEQIGNREKADNADLSSLKYQFEQECWEYRVEGCGIDYAIQSLQKKYNTEYLSTWKNNGCIPCCILYREMQSYDFTNPGGRIFNRGFSSMSHIAEGVCARMYNELAEKETKNLLEQALINAGYSGFSIKTSPEIKNISDADSSFLVQFDRCKESMMKMLEATSEHIFKEQYMECMKAMFCFGTIYKTWLLRYARY